MAKIFKPWETRPPLAENERDIEVEFSDDEMVLIKADAACLGISVNELLKERFEAVITGRKTRC
jgi:hypothetical protein